MSRACAGGHRSIPTSSATTPALSRSRRLGRWEHIRRQRRATTTTRAFLKKRTGVERDDETSEKRSLFASGSKRSEIRIPGFVAYVDVREASTERGTRAIDNALHAGATMIVLQERGMNGGVGESASGRALYESATALKDLVRGRAKVLIQDRTDIAVQAELDGVVLTDDGVPTVVARKTLSPKAVVAHVSDDAVEAEKASKEGADVLLVSSLRTLSELREKVSVPIFVDVQGGVSTLLGEDSSTLNGLTINGANGVTICDIVSDEMCADEARVKLAVSAVVDALTQNAVNGDSVERASVDGAENVTVRPDKISLVGSKGEELIERERELSEGILTFLQDNCQDLDEIKLLVEARKSIEDLFLLVIVGEFNAGKSSVINAFLGDKFVAEGILPTTNEITVLRYGERKAREQSEDGFFTYKIPAEILRQVRIVDTPGTNVILQRQQKLTEEFVPRADLILFVLSADRPMTESEVKFLTYIRKWGKKVVFVVNKTDLLEEANDVRDVSQFVKDNAERLLGVNDPAVLPVSARKALKAKKANANYVGTREFVDSGFGQFEDYVMSYLGGSGERAGEALRLKLSTPLNVCTLLLDAAEQILETEDDEAKSEVAIAIGVKTQMDDYTKEMVADSKAQQEATRSIVQAAIKRAERIVDDTLRLSNALSLFNTYILGTGSSGVASQYEKLVLGDSEEGLGAACEEFSAWLDRNNEAQLQAYIDAVKGRGFDASLSSVDNEKEERAKSLSVVSNFDHTAAAQLLDKSIGNAVETTIGSAGGAFVASFFLSGFFNSFSEDVLVYALGLAGAYIAVLSLPLKRSEIKSKIRRSAAAFLTELEETMENECTTQVGSTTQKISTICAPWAAAARAEAARVAECLEARRELKKSLENMMIDVANL